MKRTDSHHQLITIDFETYYDKEYSLSKMTTESYIRDPRFQVIGMGYKVGDYESEWFPGEEAGKKIHSMGWSNKVVLCHNTAFDGAIMSWHFGKRPALWLDTLSMARPEHGLTVGGSLAALVQHYNLGAKGTEVVNALGKRLEDFTPEELARYGQYCINDVELTLALYKLLRKGFPPAEIKTIDLLLRMFTEPVLQLNVEKLQAHLAAVQAKKADLMSRITESKDDLMSNDKFAELLKARGVDPPTKRSEAKSKTEGKDVFTWAFAKTDTEFIELQEHEDLEVQALVAARLGVKSTLEETRTERLLGIASRGAFPIMLNYYGGHTGRASGGDKVNPQNFTRGGAIRDAIEAPEYHEVVAGDSSNIEARLVAYMAEQNDLVEDFRNKVDVYCNFASEIYGRSITKADKEERHVGKTCLAGDTLLVTSRGMIPITEIKIEDLLWDGEEWVHHNGILPMGRKHVHEHCGLSATDEHEILTERGWVVWAQVRSNRSLFASALALANSRSCGGNAAYPPAGDLSGTSRSASVLVAGKDLSTGRISRPATQHDATPAQKSLRERSGIGSTRPQWQMTHTVRGSLTDWLRRLPGAIREIVERTYTMVGEALRYTLFGARTARLFSSTCKPSLGGIGPSWTWTGGTTLKGMSLEISGLSREARTPQTSGVSRTWRNACRSSSRKCAVYDVANAGPRNRFTVITTEGPLIVHNCILGLGFGTGGPKLKWSLSSKEPRVYVEEHEAKGYVDLYRARYSRIPLLWKRFNKALDVICMGGQPMSLGPNGEVTAVQGGIVLPNGMMVRYPGLEYDGKKYSYYNRKKPEKIFGAKVTENVIQALARIIVFDQMLEVQKRLQQRVAFVTNMGLTPGIYRVVLTVHDEVVCVVPHHETWWCKEMMEEVMSTPPLWAPNLPVACEVKSGRSYGDAK